MSFNKLFLAGLVVAGGTAIAQTKPTPPTKDAIKAFRNSLVKQQLALRNFSGDLSVQVRWNGQMLKWQKSYWHAVGVLSVDSVTVKNGEVLIRGDRAIVLHDPAKGYVSSQASEPMQVTIVLDGDPAASLDGLKAALFFDSISDAAADVPIALRDRLPGDTGEDYTKKPFQRDACDCVDRGTPACDGKRPDGLEPPKVLSSADPSYTDDARQRRINGSVLLTLTLNEGGDIEDLWIARPLGHGLDEQAAYAVRKYRFAPATCHGKSRRTDLTMVVNFRIY